MATTDDDTHEFPTFADGELPSPLVETVTVEFCPPFPPSSTAQPLTFDPNWRTETVLALARGIDADSAFDRLPILADALEEAGCDHRRLLDHCRTCPHPFASCWVVNVVLDRVPGELPPPEILPPPVVPVRPTTLPRFITSGSHSPAGGRGNQLARLALLFGVLLVVKFFFSLFTGGPSPPTGPAGSRSFQRPAELPPAGVPSDQP
jgi:hypothetical protein